MLKLTVLKLLLGRVNSLKSCSILFISLKFNSKPALSVLEVSFSFFLKFLIYSVNFRRRILTSCKYEMSVIKNKNYYTKFLVSVQNFWIKKKGQPGLHLYSQLLLCTRMIKYFFSYTIGAVKYLFTFKPISP